MEILLKQYSECWADIRNYSNAIWQIPTLLVATMSFLGILYGNYLRNVQIGRIVVLLLALGFTFVSIIALKKHRFFSNKRVDVFESIQEELKRISGQAGFREIKWKSEDLAKDCCWINRTSAYRWQLGLVITILFGIIILLFGEFALILRSYV